jgi:hypothetical protein
MLLGASLAHARAGKARHHYRVWVQRSPGRGHGLNSQEVRTVGWNRCGSAAVVAVLMCVSAGTTAASAQAPVRSSSYFTAQGIGTMSTGREGPATAPLPDGDVLVAGGFNGSALTSADCSIQPPARSPAPAWGR